MNQKQLGLHNWVGGFFDGEGSVQVPISDGGEGNHVGALVSLNHSYVGGFFDAEGWVGAVVQESESSKTSYHTRPAAVIVNESNDDLLTHLLGFFEYIGVEPYVSFVRRDNSNADFFRIRIGGIRNVRTFAEAIVDHTIVKRPQLEIMLDKILPRLETGSHLNRRGYLEVMAWRDILNSMKGGKRGKYNLEYFEEKFGMVLDDRRLPARHPKSDVVKTKLEEQ